MNDVMYALCPCGSGKKHKWCCFGKPEAHTSMSIREVFVNVTGSIRSQTEVGYTVSSGVMLKNCLDCGMCCGIDLLLDETSAAEIAVMPPEWLYKNPKMGKLDMKRHPNGRCIHQDPVTNKCAIYTDPRKPKVCSEFKRGQHPNCYNGKLIRSYKLVVPVVLPETI